jgi:UDP-N-acetylmuramoylalanine--D-glutamate ligase
MPATHHRPQATVQTALVLGLGTSGEGAARLLAGEGVRVTVLDEQDQPALRDRAAALRAEGVDVRLGATALPASPVDLCVVSPGIPAHAPWMMELRDRGIPIVPELELGWSRHRGRTLAVTGSNGKSTMVKWLAETLAEAGCRVQPAGNFGPPVTSVVREHRDLDWLVLEVSSFQLETARAFRPDVGILLNLVPNHLDRHGDFATYAAAKAKLFARARAGQPCVVHEHQLARMKTLSGGQGAWLSFGTSDAAAYVYDAGRVLHAGEVIANLERTCFHNPVLGVNAAGGVAALHAAGVDLRAAERAARSFRPLAHRMEDCGEKNGVRFINDSKATTLTAMAAGLRMSPGPVRLIAGGLLKEHDMALVDDIVREKVVGAYLIGRATMDLAKAWAPMVDCRTCFTLDWAFDSAWRDARKGDVILLSPACASFDQYTSFAARGDHFRNLVKQVTGE